MTVIHTSDWWDEVLQHPVCVCCHNNPWFPYFRTAGIYFCVILHLAVVYLQLMHNVWARGTAFNKQVCAEREGQNKGTEMRFVIYNIRVPQNK